MTKINRATKSMIIIIIFSIGSKLLGFIREVLIASKFGSGMETDTYFIALTATGLLTSLLGNSISTTMIPIISEVESKEGKKGKVYHTSNLLHITLLISSFIVILGWILSPTIIRIVAIGFEGEQLNKAISFMRLGLPVMFFWAIIGVLKGYLQSEMMFTESSLMLVPYNIVFIIYLIFFSSQWGIKGLVVAGVIAVGFQILVLLPGIKRVGYKYNFVFNVKDIYLRKILYLVPPVLIGVAINDLNVIIDRTMASRLVAGSISALNYSNRLSNLILGVFIAAITTVIFPMLSKEISNNNLVAMKRIMGYGINLILHITVPATVGLIVLATPIVEIAFQRGEFNATATLMTSQALIFYSLGLVAMSLRLLITRVYYSLQDTKTPMVNGAISVGFNIILNLIFVRFMAHAGLAFATSISNTIATLLMFYGLKKRIGSLGTKGYMVTFLKSGIASALMGLVAYVTYHGLYEFLGISKLNNLISLLVAVGLAVIVYVVLCYVFKVEEVRDIMDKIKVRFRR